MNKQCVIIASLLYMVAFFLLFPLYQYQLDVDGISYIKVAERIVHHQYAAAINGYWSPLSSWLLVPFIQLGLAPVLAAKYINGVLGLLCLFSFNVLFNKFSLQPIFKNISAFVLALCCLSFCFHELCADLLSLYLLSLYLILVLKDDLLKQPGRLVLATLLAALAYFAKAYNLFFFVAHISVTLCWYSKQQTDRYFSSIFFKRWLLVLFVCGIVCSPYIFAISKKYHRFTVSTAGSLNTTWQLAPGLIDSQRVVIPPPYYNAVSNWDDPTFQQQQRVAAFTSPAYFIKQLKVTAHNSLQLFSLLNSVSLFYIPVLLLFLLLLLKQRRSSLQLHYRLLLFSAVLYVAGYLLILVEWRYIWLLQVILLLISGLVLSFYHDNNLLSKPSSAMLTLMVLASFCIKPIQEMAMLKNENLYEYNVAAAMNRSGIHGNFITQIDNSSHQSSITRICYLTNSKLMGAYTSQLSMADIQQASLQYHIQYFICFTDTNAGKDSLLLSLLKANAVKIYEQLYPGVLIYQLY